MGTNKDKMQIQRLKEDLKAAKQTYGSKIRARDYRLLKLTVVLLVLLIVAAYIYGRIQL